MMNHILHNEYFYFSWGSCCSCFPKQTFKTKLVLAADNNRVCEYFLLHSLTSYNESWWWSAVEARSNRHRLKAQLCVIERASDTLKASQVPIDIPSSSTLVYAVNVTECHSFTAEGTLHKHLKIRFSRASCDYRPFPWQLFYYRLLLGLNIILDFFYYTHTGHMMML